MKNRKYQFIISTLCLSSFFYLTIYPQNDKGLNSNEFEQFSSNPNTLSNGGGFYIKKNASTNKVIGSPYINKEWKKGIIYLKSGKNYIINDINYNAYTKSLEVYLSKDSLYTFSNNDLNKFEIGNNLFIKNNKAGFSKIKYKNKQVTLLEGYSTSIKKTKFTPGIETEKRPDKLIIVKNYAIEKEGLLYTIKLRKKSIIPYLKNSKQTLKFASKHKLSFKKIEDIVTILKHDHKISIE